MTDRYAALTVALEKDMREDDAQALIAAIKTMRGVCDVTGEVVNPMDFTMLSRVRIDLAYKIWPILFPKWKPPEETT